MQGVHGRFALTEWSLVGTILLQQFLTLFPAISDEELFTRILKLLRLHEAHWGLRIQGRCRLQIVLWGKGDAASHRAYPRYVLPLI